MRIRIDHFGPVDAASAISDVMLAAALLVGAASGPTRAELAAVGALGKVIRSCNELEGALAGRPAVSRR